MVTRSCAVVLAVAGTASPVLGQSLAPYAQWRNGPSSDPNYFPIGVWLQSPHNAKGYAGIGVNLYVGLWEGPTEAQLATLKSAGMKVICAQNEVGLAHRDDPTIIGWLHQDEPDNAQWNATTQTYDLPILPSVVQQRYEQMKANDPTRPVLLNLGQGVAWDGWIGRGTRTNHPEDYPQYLKGTDIGSFDIYPVADGQSAISGQVWRVPYGVERMVSWAKPGGVTWNFIESTNISGTGQATPAQVKAELWLSVVHGSRGILYFAHQFSPTFSEAALLWDPVMAPAVTAINRQVTALAPVLNSPSFRQQAEVKSSNSAVTVDASQKYHDGYRYVFAAQRLEGTTTATVKVPDLPAGTSVEVIDEGRTVTASADGVTDTFSNYGVHLYRYRVPTWTGGSAAAPGKASAGGNWSSAVNPLMPVHFGKAATSPTMVDVDRPMTVGGMSFHSAQPYTISSSGGVTLASAYDTARVTVEAGHHAVVAGLTFATPGEVILYPGTSLRLKGRVAGEVAVVNLGGGAELDIAAGSLVFAYDLPGASTPAEIAALVRSGFAGGTWGGEGVTSSMAAADARHLTALAMADNADLGLTEFDGQLVRPASVLLRFTYYGDANLDGRVDAADLARLDRGFTLGLDGWANGDFNYDGRVDADDYSLIDRAMAHQGDAVAPTVGRVPEPGVAGMFVAAGMVGLLARRRHGL